jgi:hypothetical protein
MKTRIFRKVVVLSVFVVFVSTYVPAQTVEPQAGKLPGRFQRFDPSNELKNLLPFQQDDRSSTDNIGPLGFHDGTRDLKHQKLDLSVPNLQTIPYWSDHFDYHGLRYTYKMVGTDPQRGPTTTVIPTELIPIRWVLPNGFVFDASTDIIEGQTPVQGIINSPIFQDYDFTSGGTHVGNTQYGDAFQRANFWNSTRGIDYHVKLGQPTVLPVQMVNVPAGAVSFQTLPTGYLVPVINIGFVSYVSRSLIASLNVSPQTLPIVVWGRVNAGGAGGYHEAYQNGNSIQTYIGTSYYPQSAFGYGGDVFALSHEVIEWMDDPLVDNQSAGWNGPFDAYNYDFPPHTGAGCEGGLLETADPFEFLGPVAYTPVTINGSSYHLAEGAFIDFFTRNSRSRSVNGQYSFFEVGHAFGLDTPPSSECLSSLQTDNQYFTVPGSLQTVGFGMNNTGSVVGYYIDTAGMAHGFRKDGDEYTTVDFPGAVGTLLTGINDSGAMVGYYFGPDGIPHGFSVKNGQFTPVDFPGSVDTIATGINNSGVIVGGYDFTQPVTHGFALDSGGYQSVDSPYGSQNYAASVNNLGTIAGNFSSDLSPLQSGFIKTRNTFERFDFPDTSVIELTSINSFGDLGGLSGRFPFSFGFVRLFGYPYTTSFTFEVSAVNDKREILGLGFNVDTFQVQPFIGRAALADGNGR